MKFLISSLVSISILLTFGCQSDSKIETSKKTTHIFAKYYVRYLQTEKELKAEVSFKEGDSLATARSIVLTNVTFEGEPMNVQNLGKTHGVRYGSRKTGLYKDQYEFKYNGDQFGTLGHTIKMNPITDFELKEDKINKASGGTLIWQGKPLQKNQELILLFTDEQKKAFPLQIKGPSEKPEIKLTAQELTGLTPGKGQLMLVKKQISQSEEDNFSKISEMEFYSKHIDIPIHHLYLHANLKNQPDCRWADGF